MGALLENSQRKFVMVEMSFIWRWWKRLDEDYKKIIRKLMNEGKTALVCFSDTEGMLFDWIGRLDIAGGSWTSNDEAVSHYAAMIDQSTLGFRFLKSELRSCPQPAVAWQLDLFGHGREINSLFAQVRCIWAMRKTLFSFSLDDFRWGMMPFCSDAWIIKRRRKERSRKLCKWFGKWMKMLVCDYIWHAENLQLLTYHFLLSG